LNWAKNEIVNTRSSNRGKGTLSMGKRSLLPDCSYSTVLVLYRTGTTAAKREENTDLHPTIAVTAREESEERKNKRKLLLPFFLSSFLLLLRFL